MKKLMVLLLVLSICSIIEGQTPSGFSFQAVLRSGSGQVLGSQAAQFRVTLTSSDGLTMHYQEVHNVTSSAQGIINVIVGNGSDKVGLLTEVPWGNEQIVLKTEIKVGSETTFTLLGTQSLQAVPYALYASNAKEVESSPTANDEEPIFVVKNKLGQIVFAVYQGSVKIFVDDVAKGAKGGFAVGGLSGTKVSTSYFTISPDSARIYVNEQTGKGAKGGFAVGGLSGTKSADQFLNLTPENYFIGHQSGNNNTTGMYNSILGYRAAYSNTEGSDNIFIGYQSGYANKVGLNNIFIGKSAGFNNVGEIQTQPYYLAYGSYNVFIGNESGYNNISGWTNLFLGNQSGYGNKTGSDNTFIGNFSGENNNNGFANAYLGAFSGRANVSGQFNVNLGFYSGNQNTNSNNTFVGSYAGETNSGGGYNTMLGSGTGQNSVGSMNVFIGAMAGYNSGGSQNVFIGYNAGYNEAASSRLYIENSNSTAPLVYGEFDNDVVKLNAKVTIRDFYALEQESITLSNGAILSTSKSNVLVSSSSAITLNSSTPVANGAVIGQVLILAGTSDTNTVTLPNSGNLQIGSSIALGQNDCLMLLWNGSKWIKISYSNN